MKLFNIMFLAVIGFLFGCEKPYEEPVEVQVSQTKGIVIGKSVEDFNAGMYAAGNAVNPSTGVIWGTSMASGCGLRIVMPTEASEVTFTNLGGSCRQTVIGQLLDLEKTVKVGKNSKQIKGVWYTITTP